MSSLQFLSLEKNNFDSIDKVRCLSEAEKLRYLSLQDNPIQEILKTYRYDLVQILPNLYALDNNTIMFDEIHRLFDNRSVRYCSMNYFSRCLPQATVAFIPNLVANQHLSLLNEQIAQLKKSSDLNNPVIAIQKWRKRGAFRDIGSKVV